MPLITQADLGTHLYADVLNEITRADSTIVSRAIDAATQEAKMYLGRYDLLQLFGSDTVAPTVQDEYLKSLLKDIACWHIIRLANANVDYNAYRTAYQDAIAVLKSIMCGDANPEGWPYRDPSADSFPDGDDVSWCSNPKRENYF